jgi:hypothetical protein
VARERLRDPEERSAPHQRPASGADPAVARLLALQRSAGNAAVAGLIGARRTLARFEAGEHAQMGGSGHATIGTPEAIGGPQVSVSEGQLIALGDFYASFREMEYAPVSQLEELLKLIERDRKFRLGQGEKEVSAEEWTKAKPDYAALTLDNAAHFAPGSGPASGADHKSTFAANHKKALALAHSTADIRQPTVTGEAIARNAFACHFLTDAFAAGHLFNKEEMIARIGPLWNAQETFGFIAKQTAFTAAVATKVMADHDSAAELAKYEVKIGLAKDVTPTTLSQFMFGASMDAGAREPFLNAILNLVHNRLNNSSVDDPAFAIEVTNKKGMTWTLAGDGTLNSESSSAAGDKTLMIAQEAVAEADRNLQAASKIKTKDADDDALVEGAWAFTPTPTALGAQHMEALIVSALNFDSERAADEFAAISIKNLGSVIAQAVKLGYMWLK